MSEWETIYTPPKKDKEGWETISTTPPVDHTQKMIEEMPWLERMNIMLGRGLMDVGQGIKQFALDMTDPEAAQKYTQEVEDERRLIAPLEDYTTGGTVARIAGNIAATAPTMLIPGANAGNAARLANAATQGLLAGGAQFVPEGESRLQNAATGGLLGAGFQVAVSSAPAAVRKLFRGDKDKYAENLSLFRELDIAPTVGTIQGGRSLGFEGYLGKAPGGVRSIHGAGVRMQAGIRDKLSGLIDDLGKSGASDEAGAAAQRGVENFKKTVSDGWVKLNKRVDKFFKPTDPVSVKKTALMLEELTTTKSQAATALTSKARLVAMKEAFDKEVAERGGNYSYEMLRDLRTAIGNALGDTGLTDDAGKGALKALLKAVNEDLMGAAIPKGKAAVRALDQSDKFYSRNMDKLDGLLGGVYKINNPDKVFDAVWSGSKAGPTMVRQLRGALSKGEWKEVQATFIRKLGTANPSQQSAAGDLFNSNTFLTNWNNLQRSGNKKTLKAIFNGNSQLVADLNKVAKAAEMIGASRIYGNPSQSGLAAGAIGTGGLALGGAVSGKWNLVRGVMAVFGANYGLSRLMGNHKFVNWLARSTELPSGNVASHIAKLKLAIDQTEDQQEKEEMGMVYNELTGQK